MLGVIGAGLLALCCVCFVIGYELGTHGTALPGLKGAAVKDAGPSAAEILAQAKPTAAPAASASKPVVPSVTIAKVSTPATAPKDADLPTADPPPVTQSRTAVPNAATPSSPSQAPAGNPVVRPALAVTTAQSAVSWHVQVAAVEHTDDAEVLVSALRKRGYAVSIHHDLTDNLLHVQIGPFVSRSDAEAARRRLLDDGYNAIIQY